MDKLKHVYDLIDKIKSTRDEIIKLENAIVVENENTPLEVEVQEQIFPEQEEKESIDELGEEVSFYFDDIKSILTSGDISRDDLIEVLPSKDNVKYDFLIKRIILELIREMNEINNFIIDEEISLEELYDFTKDKENIKSLINLIRDISLEKDEISENAQKNTIVFFEKEDGSPYVLDDLKGIPLEFNKPFIELFESIENGSFKNVKHFNESNNKISKVWEVKGYQVRVIFERIDKHKYVVISAFIKKSDKDLYYQTHLKTRLARYFYKRDMIKKNINDSEYLTRSEDAIDKLYQFLGREDLEERSTYHV